MWTRTGSGSVFTTKNNGRDVYVAKIILKNTETQKTISITGTGGTKRQAIERRDQNVQKRLKKLGEETNITEVEDLPLPQRQEKKKPAQRGTTLSDFITIWEKTKGQSVKARTRINYMGVLRNHIEPRLGGKLLKNITLVDLTILFNTTIPLEDKLSPSTHYSVFRITKTFFNDAVTYGYISENPLSKYKIKRPRPEVHEQDIRLINKRTRIFKGLLRELSNPEHEDHESYPIVLLMALGMRRGEILGLKWSCITGLDRKNKCKISVRQQLIASPGNGYYIQNSTKTGVTREFYVPEAVRKALREHKKQQTKNLHDMVFVNPEGDYYPYGRFDLMWRRVLTRYMTKNGRVMRKDDYWRPHANRKIAASMLSEQGTALPIAASILGHDSETMFMYYSLVKDVDKQVALEKLSQALDL